MALVLRPGLSFPCHLPQLFPVGTPLAFPPFKKSVVTAKRHLVGFDGSQLTSHVEEFLFVICPPVVSLQRGSHLEPTPGLIPKAPFSTSVTPLPPFFIIYVILHPIQGPPPIRASEVHLALKVTEKELAGFENGVTGWEGLLCV